MELPSRIACPLVVAVTLLVAFAPPARAEEPGRNGPPRVAAPRTDAARTEAAKTDAAKTDAGKTDAARKDAPKSERARISYPPMIFFVAKGSADECGPGCDSWIAAFGEIDAGAASRFEAFLNRLGRNDIPIFIQSPGGLTLRATAMGELLRSRKMRISVGRTLPAECGSAPYTPECNRVRVSGRSVPATLKTNAVCASACVYMLLGGARREVAWDAALGVHSSKVVLSRNGRPVRSPGPGVIQEAQRREAAMIDRYVRKMGIDSELMTVTRSVPFESIRRLTREEIARFGIDTRESGDSGWSVQPVSSRPSAVVVMFRKGWGGGRDFALVRLALSCVPGGVIDLDYATLGTEASRWPSGNLVVRFGEDRVRLAPVGTSRSGTNDRASAFLASDIAERLARADSIALLHETSGGGEVLMQTQIGTAGYAAAIRPIVQQCLAPGAQKQAASGAEQR